MKKIYLFIVLFQFGLVFSQQTKIDNKRIIPDDIDFNSNVKKITLKIFDINTKAEKNDTTKTFSEIYFSKFKKILKINKFDKSIENLWSTIEFDNLERIKTISKKNNGKIFNSVIQYFSTDNEFSDSTNLYINESYKEKYINYFKNKLVIRQDHFVNDSLQDYRLYKYNDKNQLVEEMYQNPENDSDETVVSKADNQLSFYPEKFTKYEYKVIKDTLISIIIRPKYNLKKVTKKLKTKNYSLEIKEDFDNDFLENSRLIYKYKDSIIDLMYYYNDKKEIKSYYKTVTTQKNIISEGKTEGYRNNEKRIDIINIDIIYDKFKNWIRKTYSKANLTTKIIEREIEYY